MENLFNGGKFIDQTNLGWTFSFEANGKYPMIANRIFEKLIDAETYLAGPTAIPGIILRVVDDIEANNGAYLVEKDGTGNLWMNKIMTGDIDILLTVVWAKQDPSTGKWEEVPQGTPGAVQCLKLTHAGQSTYIPLSKILVLDEYAKIVNVDASLAIRDSSITYLKLDSSVLHSLIELMQQDVSNYKSITNAHLDIIDSSLIDAYLHLDLIDEQIININEFIADINEDLREIHADITDINQHIVEIDSSITNIKEDIAIIDSSLAVIDYRLDEHDDHLAIIDSSIEKIQDTLDNHVVKDIKAETHSKFVEVSPKVETVGHVTMGIDLSICDTYKNDGANGLVSANYLEERISWEEN